jgi:hypothetical protein
MAAEAKHFKYVILGGGVAAVSAHHNLPSLRILNWNGSIRDSILSPHPFVRSITNSPPP